MVASFFIETERKMDTHQTDSLNREYLLNLSVIGYRSLDPSVDIWEDD